MRVIKRPRLVSFWTEHPDSEARLTAWYRIARAAKWTNAADVVGAWPKTSAVANSRFVFNIMGNHYRLIAKINFRRQIVFIRFVGTHSEYDDVDANTI